MIQQNHHGYCHDPMKGYPKNIDPGMGVTMEEHLLEHKVEIPECEVYDFETKNKRQPWECPRCHRINASWVDHCDCKEI